PCLHYLRQDKELVHHSKVWPFETAFTTNPFPTIGPFILHAEIWPGGVKRKTQMLMEADHNVIRDQAQVTAMCLWASKLDDKDELESLFDKPGDLNDIEIKSCIEQEGWILGAK